MPLKSEVLYKFLYSSNSKEESKNTLEYEEHNEENKHGKKIF